MFSHGHSQPPLGFFAARILQKTRSGYINEIQPRQAEKSASVSVLQGLREVG
jgi:hypothetical protein